MLANHCSPRPGVYQLIAPSCQMWSTKVHKTFGGLSMDTQPLSERMPIWPSATITRCPEKISEMTEEELKAFESAMYENLMAKFAEDLPTEDTENA